MDFHLRSRSNPAVRTRPRRASALQRLSRKATGLALTVALCACADVQTARQALAPGAAPDGPPLPCQAPRADAFALPAWQPLAERVWWLPADAGDSHAGNRGRVSNLLLVEGGERLWLIGSGPSRAFGMALRNSILCITGREPTDLVSPWPRPELVLGQVAMPDARSWAHREVAGAMAERCPGCVARLRERLGVHAADVSEPAIRIPDRFVDGDQGRLGPLRWWRLRRSPDTPVTVWWHPASGVATAHGLLWHDGAPDLRDARIDTMLSAARALRELADELGPGMRWLPEQGPPGDGGSPARIERYWIALSSAVERAQASGALETDAAPTHLPGYGDVVDATGRHALNWQRAWRQVDEAELAPQRGVFQRSLR